MINEAIPGTQPNFLLSFRGQSCNIQRTYCFISRKNLYHRQKLAATFKKLFNQVKER